jgi:hypothetical protein
MAGAQWLWVRQKAEAQSRLHPAKRELWLHPPPSAQPAMVAQAGTERWLPIVLPAHSAELALAGTSTFRSPEETSADQRSMLPSRPRENEETNRALLSLLLRKKESHRHPFRRAEQSVETKV